VTSVSAQTLIWLIIGLIGVADSITLLVQRMALEWGAESRNIVLLLSFLLFARLLLWWQKPQAARFTIALIQALTFAHLGTIFTYALMAASPFPMADPLFERVDVALGFDWLAWFQWIVHHQTIHIILFLAYHSMIPQVFVLTAIFSYVNSSQVDEFLVAAILAVIIIFPFIYLLPSIGAFAPHGITGASWEADILTMRSHATHLIRPAEGIVTFPSYHAALGLLLVNMARGRWWLFGPLLVLNTVMMTSVMNIGGHYLVDLLGGIVVGAVALSAARYLLSLCTREATAKQAKSIDPMPA
jgi:hypothetical protein